MMKLIAAGAGVCALAVVANALIRHQAPRPEPAAAIVATPEARPADAANVRAMSKREQMARLVAETAAVTADRTARSVLARRSGLEQTASR